MSVGLAEGPSMLGPDPLRRRSVFTAYMDRSAAAIKASGVAPSVTSTHPMLALIVTT